jgi:hypothetical protein
MENLVSAVAQKTGMPVDFVETCIVLHQRQYPGSWQDWRHDDRVKAMCAMLREAKTAGETSPTRIVDFHG